ncbi:MAG: hypothetical protein ACKV2T_31525 [Kofleriaceae bacterium]
MIRAFVIVSLLGGCELIADIPTSTPIDPDAMDDGDATPPECTDSAACTMVGKPICDLTTNTCGGCVADSECASNVCLMDGTCADPARFVYAAAGGSDTACTVGQPCTVDTAVTMLTATKDIVKLAPGTYARAAPLNIAIAGTLAGGGSTFTVAGPAGTAAITATGVPVHILGLTLNVATNNSAIRCNTVGGELHLSRMRISGSNAGIVSLCPLVVDRTTITGAAFYALYANAAPVTIRNSYIVRTGTMATLMIAAVQLEDVPSGTIEHVTIANTTAAGPSGLRCPGSAGVTIRNIIAWDNVAPGIDPTCVVSNSIVDPGYTTGTANMSISPMFLDAANTNYRLMPLSPAGGAGTRDAMFGIDGDGEDRPQPPGSNPDPGADEIP